MYADRYIYISIPSSCPRRRPAVQTTVACAHAPEVGAAPRGHCPSPCPCDTSQLRRRSSSAAPRSRRRPRRLQGNAGQASGGLGDEQTPLELGRATCDSFGRNLANMISTTMGPHIRAGVGPKPDEFGTRLRWILDRGRSALARDSTNLGPISVELGLKSHSLGADPAERRPNSARKRPHPGAEMRPKTRADSDRIWATGCWNNQKEQKGDLTKGAEGQNGLK